MGVFVVVVAALLWGSTVGFEAGQGNPDTKNLFTSIAEKNTSPE
jgi:hypothetical protein